ncbi:ATP-grasp fold amidoligase family protein [Aureibaculum luteum]|uniref:ATP-grasp fold amidoligase family protein n=1 Tax=Aureibaculum luteum TaxID=1548456 RepID=UPI000E4A29B4|nr:ATP-grasp fold amidoligase family protein [Aureibaculum luteum]
MTKIIYRVLKNFKFLPKPTVLKLRYKYYTGKTLRLNKPVEFNEKLQWLKMYYHVPLLTQLACKYESRTYVKEKIGAQYLNELYGVYDAPDKVEFDKFPKQFVLKGVHGSSLNIIVKDKSTLDVADVKLKMQKWMQHCQYKRVGYEWAYKNIKPRIICEKYLEEPGKDAISDYKFFCFNGVPKFIQIDIDRSAEHMRCYYDMDWNKLPFKSIDMAFLEENVVKPSNFEEMKKLSITLADKLPFVRVDFYAIDGVTYFGELTFYPKDCKKEFTPEKYNKIIGDYLELPKIPNGQKVITSIS